MTQRSRQRHILLVEDSSADALLAREAFREADSAVEVTVAADGATALEYLQGLAAGGAQPRPDLVLLDLNLGSISGHEVLAAIKADPGLKRIPVVVLTTSVAESDVESAYAHHANSYLRKPVSFDEFVVMAKMLDDYWFRLVRLPSA